MNDMGDQFAADMDLYASLMAEIDQLNQNFDGLKEITRWCVAFNNFFI